MTTKPATIISSEIREMTSKQTGRKYRISIGLPYAYHKSRGSGGPFDKPLEQWPVVYLVDGDLYFGMVTDIVRAMAWCGTTTDAIVIGIGYPQDKDPQEAWRNQYAWRNQDLSPFRDEAIEKADEAWVKRPAPTGGAGHFLNLIQHELIPVIDKDFRTDSKKRILAGHSSGGTFATFALFAAPGLFSTYIVGSPALADGDRYIFNYEEAFAKRHKKLAAQVHLWAGGREEALNGSSILSDTIRFGAILEGRQYKGLKLTRQIFPDEYHCEVIAPGFQAGLKLALKK
jgi:predicted alpha/beta superfamily hydrolase